jgi:hypothetical protein
MPYVSITGMRVRSVWHYPRFVFHAVRSMVQAKEAAGNLSADARKIDGVYFTVTVWTDRAAMLAYLQAGAHRRAMKACPSIGSGYAFGFEAAARPDWSDVEALWLAEGERRAERGQTVTRAPAPDPAPVLSDERRPAFTP